MVSRLLRSLLDFAWCFVVTGAVMAGVGFASGRASTVLCRKIKT
jgi:hypothetical protein